MSIGTPFGQTVWREIAKIPYGDTATYKEISERICKPKAVRAVATAVGANALSFFIQCHCIVGSDGVLRGYAGTEWRRRRSCWNWRLLVVVLVIIV